MTTDTGTLTPTEPTTSGGVQRPTAGFGTNLVLAILGGWFTVGLMLDAWAHNNIPELETFFTSWHAAFYSGFAATAAWVMWTCHGAIREDQRALAAIPTGYAATLVALVGFALAGVGDLTWHTVLGIEQDIDILFSPTHIGLITTMLIIVSTPLRSAWADATLTADAGLRRLLPAVLSVAFSTTLLLLFVQYANVLTYSSRGVTFALSRLESGDTGRFASEALVTTILFTAPLLTIARRWRPPVGAATIVYLALGGLSTAVTGFENLDLMIGFLVAGILVDILGFVLKPGPDRLARLRAYGALVALITWVVLLVTAYLTHPGLAAKPELLYGLPLVQCMVGLLLAALLVPNRTLAR